MKESPLGTLFLVHSALDLSTPGPMNPSLSDLRQAPHSLPWVLRVALGVCGLLLVSSFHLEVRVNPVPMAHDGSSVNRGRVTALGPLPPGSGRRPLAWFWHCRGWDTHGRALFGCTSTVHKQWDPHVLVCVQGTGLQCSAMHGPQPQPSFREKAMAT